MNTTQHAPSAPVVIKILGIVLSTLLAANSCFAQQDNPEGIILDLFNQQQDESNYVTYFENLMQYYNAPLDLNKATAEDLENLRLLDPLQIRNLLAYREKTGYFISLYELQTIPLFDLYTIKKIIPFITIGGMDYSTGLLTRLMRNKNNYTLCTFSSSLRDNKDKEYAGDDHRVLIRHRNYKLNDFSYGLVLEKDAGEQITWSPATRYYLFDFLSGHFALYNKKQIKAMIIGDYQLQFGQGLVFSGGLTMGKSAETILSVKKNNLGIRPHTSSQETGYFRGAAITWKIKSFELTPFFSYRRTDGKIAGNDSSFTAQYTGYHRTPEELAHRNSVIQADAGGNISFRSRDHRFHAGVSSVFTCYDHALTQREAPYAIYHFHGKNNFTSGADITYSVNNHVIFAEGAFSKGGGKGWIAGVISSLSPSLETSFVVRHYDKDFHSFYAGALAENTVPMNEKGIYWGLKYTPVKTLQFTAYVDRFSFPWLKYNVSAPSEGNEIMARLTWLPNKNSVFYLQLKKERKEKNFREGDSGYVRVEPYTNTSFIVNAESSAMPFSARSRIQYSIFRQATVSSSGFAIIQDIECRLKKIILSSRFALFQTAGFESRQYVYERDILYSFSIPFYYQKGVRTYMMVQYRINSRIDLWLRVARTIYLKDTEIPVAGSTKDDIKIQCRFVF